MITGCGKIAAKQEVAGQTNSCSRTLQLRLVGPRQFQTTTFMVTPVHPSLMTNVTDHVTADGVGHPTKTGQALTPIADANLPPLPSSNDKKYLQSKEADIY